MKLMQVLLLFLLPLPPLFPKVEPEAKWRLSMAKFVFVWSAATINAILLSAYAVIYTLVAAAYTWATYFNRHHFYLQARYVGLRSLSVGMMSGEYM